MITWAIQVNGVKYTQEDIDNNLCPLNGQLIDSGLKHWARCEAVKGRSTTGFNPKCLKCNKDKND